MDDQVPLEGEIGRRMAEVAEVRFALLFGSRATGRSRRGSDIDLAFYLDDALSARERFDLRLRLVTELVDLGRPDIVILNDAPPLLGHRALLGHCVFMRDRATYVRYFVRTLAASEDERPWRRLHRNARRKRILEGRFGRP